MTKVKKSVSKAKSKFSFQLRATDALFLLGLGLFSALNFSLHQDLKSHTNNLLQEQGRVHTQLASHVAQEIEDLRSSVRALQIKTNGMKKHPPKGKKLAGMDSEDLVELGSSVHLDKIKELLSQSPQGSRGLASVDGEEHGKSWAWVFTQLGLSLAWMCVIGAILLLIVRMLGNDTSREDS